MFSWNNVQYMFVSRSQFNQKNISANVFPNKICENSGDKKKSHNRQKKENSANSRNAENSSKKSEIQKNHIIQKKHNIQKIK